MRDKTIAADVEDVVNVEDDVGRNHHRTTLVSEETWAEIRTAYLAGATAREIEGRWGVAARTVYARAAAGGWTKRQAGDDAARARAQESYARDARRDGAIASHFREDGVLDVEDAADMGARALAASATAMQHGDVASARGLVQMAEAYYRIAPRQRARMLWYMMDVLEHEGTADELFGSVEDDTHPVKLRYRAWKEDRQARARANIAEIHRLQRKVKEVEKELEIAHAAHAADKAQLFEAWAKEPVGEQT